MTKKSDWTREEFEILVINPAHNSETLATLLLGRSADSIELIRNGLHAFHTGKNTSMLSKLMLARLEASENAIICPICEGKF